MNNHLKTLNATREETIQVANGNLIKTHKAIIESTGNVVSVVKQSYNPLHNQEFMNITEQMSDISGFEISGYSQFFDGGVVLAHLKNTEQDFSFNGHKMEDYIVLGNSHNGTRPFFIGTTTQFLWCTNQFSQIRQFESIRHTKNANDRFEELIKGFNDYVELRKRMYKKFEMFKNVQIDDDVKELLQRKILDIKAEERLDEISTRKSNQLELLDNSMIVEMEELGENLFALFNGTTRFVRDMDYKNKSFGNLFGTGQTLNQRAFIAADQVLTLNS